MKWNIEWIDLQNIEHMIAECWRMNERQLERYCIKLSQQKELVFAGELGIKFLELMCKSINLGETPDWPKLQKDVRLMKELIQDGQDQHEVYWKSQYQELTADTTAYFGTEFGRAFTEQLAVKLELDMSEEQKMLQNDIRKIQKICASCKWEDEEKAQKAISLLIQDEKYYFSSWLGDAFINVLQERYGKKGEDEEELELGFKPEIKPKPKVVRRSSSLKAKIVWTLVVCISAGAAVFWLYMQSKDSQSRLKLQNLMLGIISSVEEKTDAAVEDQDFIADAETTLLADSAGNEENGLDVLDSAKSRCSETAGQALDRSRGKNTSGQTKDDSSSNTSGQMKDDSSSNTAGQMKDDSSDEAAGQSSDKESAELALSQNDSDILDRNTADTGMADSWEAAAVPDILPQYQSFYQNCPDLFGWLKIPGTEIDHPVMQADDNERGERYYYLHRDYMGRSSEAGSLFVESKSSCFPQDDNTVIYGHNMSNGCNFGILEKYKEKNFFKNHQMIQYDTIYETGTYQIAAVLITRILYQEEEGFRYYRFYNYSTKSEFQECTEFIKENRLYDTGEELQYGDQLLMLSTCEYSRPNGRLVVVARKVK